MNTTQHSTPRTTGTSQIGGQFASRPSITETLIETLSENGLRRTRRTEPALRGKSVFRRLTVGAACAGALALAFNLSSAPEMPSASPARQVGILEVTRGSVALLPMATDPRSTEASALAIGTPIHAGAVIDTGARALSFTSQSTTSGEQVASQYLKAGRASLRLAGGQSLRLADDSRVRFASASSIVLERGAVYIDSEAKGSVEVRTRLGIVRDIGTQFEVRLLPETERTDSLRVRVREGSVLLELADDSHHATLGEELLLTSGGSLARGTSPIHGPHWDWVIDAAPTPDLDGKSLLAFLDWITHESGWNVHYSDDNTQQLASSTILHGSIQDLTPHEATHMVLASSGLAYELDGGTLVLARDSAS